MKDAAGLVQSEGKIGSTRLELDVWVETLPLPRTIAMEATIFTGWIYDHLLPQMKNLSRVSIESNKFDIALKCLANSFGLLRGSFSPRQYS